MNLRVDLILPGEQRTASSVNVKGIIQIIAIVVPLILLVIVGNSWMSLSNLKSTEADKTATWADRKPKKDAAAKLREEVAVSGAMYTEIKGLNKSRLLVYKHLVILQKLVPDDMQIIRGLNVVFNPSALDGVAAKTYVISFEVQFPDPTGEGLKAKEFIKKIENAPALKDIIEPVLIEDFKASTMQGAGKHDRMCKITYKYRPRKTE